MFELFDAYRKQNTQLNSSREKYCDVDYLLRLWRKNKDEYLRPLFGDNLILEKEVEYERGNDQLRDDMYNLLRKNASFAVHFVEAMQEHAINTNEENFMNVLDNIRSCLRSAGYMVDNNLYLGYVEFRNEQGYFDCKDIKSFTFKFDDGKRVQVQNGMKITRAITQLCEHIGMSAEWEQFRIAHSQVLNQKKLKGNLCLSIHPLDYATASDNDNGWSSCMSWREEGCYRMGTVEMMNSPMVICAYLKSTKQAMSIEEDNDWNSKKWRAWIIVTKDVIICNRHYPYHQEHFATKAIEWVRELVGEKYGWEYEDIHTDFMDYERQTNREVEFHTNYMYNDIGGDDVIGCFRKGAKMTNLPGYINFSGPAECMICGKEIPYDVQGSDTLTCSECRTYATCSCCGRELDEDECYNGPDGEIYCEDCFNEKFAECDRCGCTETVEDIKTIEMPIYQEAFDKWCKEMDDNGSFNDRSQPYWQVWRNFRHRAGWPTGEYRMCSTCRTQLSITSIRFNDQIIYVPDPHSYTMESAYDLVNPDEWYWATHESDWPLTRRESAPYVKRLYEINWEFFVKKNFPDLLDEFKKK